MSGRRNRPRALWVLLTLAIAAAPAASDPVIGADAEAVPQLLLRWQTHVEYDGEFFGETLIYRDGLVIDKGGRVGGGVVVYVRGVARPGELPMLRAAIAENHIGTIVADGCRAVNFLPTGGSYSAVLTWFGRGGRQNRLEFGSVGSTNPANCAAEVNPIALAVNRYVAIGYQLTDVVTTAP